MYESILMGKIIYEYMFFEEAELFWRLSVLVTKIMELEQRSEANYDHVS